MIALKKLVVTLILISMFATVAYASTPPPLPYAVYGVVKDSSGNPVDGALVTITYTRTGASGQVHTASDGTFYFALNSIVDSYNDGDQVDITASKNGAANTTTIYVDQSQGGSYVEMTLQPGAAVVPQATSWWITPLLIIFTVLVIATGIYVIYRKSR